MVSVHPPKQSADRSSRWAGVLDSEGIPDSVIGEVLAVPYNDPQALAQCLEAHSGRVAGVLVDPAMNASGLIEPVDGFLETAASLARRHGSLLLFDEVVTGFRYCLGGAQVVHGVVPDLAAFGKVLGGGVAIGAVAGRRDIMSVFELGPKRQARVPHAGTFNGNPLALSAARAVLSYLIEHPDAYAHIDQLGEMARAGISALARRTSLPLLASGAKSMFQVHYGLKRLRNHEDFLDRDVTFRDKLYWFMATRGTHCPSSGTFFLSPSHTGEHVKTFLSILEEFLSSVHESTALSEESGQRGRN